jgi:hypothetical protein
MSTSIESHTGTCIDDLVNCGERYRAPLSDLAELQKRINAIDVLYAEALSKSIAKELADATR